MKYIDADKLIAEIEKRKKELFEIGGDTFENRWACGSLDSIEAFVISLQQEQPDKSFCEENCKGYRDTGGKCFFGFNCSVKKAQEQSEENKLPSKRTRVNYAICKLQSFKPLRENIVLDNYVYDEDKCYRENLLNYIHAIPENRLTEIRNYLKEKGRWPYDDDSDWAEQEQPEAEINLGNEVENFCLEYDARKDAWYNMTPQDQKLLSNPTWLNFATNIARHFYELGLNARKEE